MLKGKQNTHLFLSMLLVIALITTSIFASFGDGDVFASNGSDSGSSTISETDQIEELTVEADPDAKYDGYIVKVEDGKTGKVDKKAVDEYESTKNNEYVKVDNPEDTLDFVEPEYVEYVEPNYLRYSMDSDSKTINSIKTTAYNGHNASIYKMIDVDKAWDKNYSGSGSLVSVFDSGLNTKHKALVNIKSTRNFINSYSSNVTSNNVGDGLGHGSFVTGLIAASSSALGLKGVAYASGINSYKVIQDNGKGSVGDFLFSLQYVDYYESTPDVINMSFGGPGYSRSEYNYINKLSRKGSIIIAATGNEGEKGSPYNYPANYSNVIGVGSIGANGAVSSFSNKNTSVLVVAPGENMTSISRSGETALSYPNYRNGYNSGTSYASPLVAGAAALFDQDGTSGTTQSQFLTLIKSTSTDINTRGYDIYSGYGILDIGEMVDKVELEGLSKIKRSWQIAYEPAGGTISGSPNTIHTEGSTTSLLTKNNVKRKGYTFSHWIDQNGTRRTSLNSSFKGGDLMLVAIWAPNKYKLKFKGNGGKVKSKSKTVKYNTAVGSLKAPKKRSGYNFLGWYTKKSGGSQYYKGKIYTKTKNLTLYARWTKSKVVKFKANGGTVSKYAKKIKNGNKYGKLPKAKRSGYVFKGWYTKKKGGNKVTKNTTVKRSGNITLYAHWQRY